MHFAFRAFIIIAPLKVSPCPFFKHMSSPSFHVWYELPLEYGGGLLYVLHKPGSVLLRLYGDGEMHAFLNKN